MHRTCCVLAGVVLAFTLAGCSETPPETGTIPFKGTSSPAIDALKENMSKTAKTGAYNKQPKESDIKKAEEKKPADIKPAPETKEPEKKP